MSITAAMSNAISGLTAASRGTELVASNIANASTPGYGVRSLSLSARTSGLGGGGVRIDGVTRHVPATILGDYRAAQSAFGAAKTGQAFQNNMTTEFGTTDDPTSLNALVTALDSALAYAAAGPDSETRLVAVVSAASSLTDKINSVGAAIQNARTDADKAIANDVNRLNDALANVSRLNRLVTIAQAEGQDTSSLLDQRQVAIDNISDIVPLREIPRDTGAISLFTAGGAPLLDGAKPATIGFTPTHPVSPEMTVGGGILSRLSLNGEALSPAQMRMFKGGRIEANFAIRDDLAPTYQSKIDSFAENLVTCFSSLTTDSTLPPDAPGLFVDGRTPSLPANHVGMAGKLKINPRVDSGQGGSPARIRDGIGATSSGPAGDSTHLLSLRSALSTGVNAFTATSNLQSYAATNRIQAEATTLGAQTYAEGLNGALRSHGVDPDSEMEKLLQLQNAYAANAKVIQTINSMFDSILGLR